MNIYMFLSFADPESGVNKGVCIVEASEMIEAVSKAAQLNINPGGEVLASPMTLEQFKGEPLALNTLYTSEQVKKLGYHSIGDIKGER